MRSTRKQPFCWQEKTITRFIRKKYNSNKSKMSKMLLLYVTITEIDSDFNNKDIKYYTKTIHTYSGLSLGFIPKGLKELEEIGIIKIHEIREKGQFKTKTIEFTPTNINDTVSDLTINTKPTNGESINGKQQTIRRYSILEDSNYKEDNINNIEKNKKKKAKAEKSNNFSNTKNSNYKEINHIINLFSSLNPVLDYGNKTQRSAIEYLISKIGFEKLKVIVEYAIKIQMVDKDIYAPRITTPLELKNKFSKLMLHKSNNINNTNVIGVIS